MIAEILATAPVAAGAGEPIGTSRGGRPVRGFRFGSGAQRISLLAGCHADEPVGPSLLRRVCAHFTGLSAGHPLLTNHQWWIIPHINPDGEERNRAWTAEARHTYDLAVYLSHVVRELPGDDIEFGFPRDPADRDARPENRAAYEWWRSTGGAFALHVSLHGMGFAAGPWFLLEPAWRDRTAQLMDRCRLRVQELGYQLHDVERRGEKGFERIARGFATRPDSRAMRDYFLARGDPDTGGKFRPSSMETIRSLGGDPLTLVSEMPLFVTPGVGETLGPPDPVATAWRERRDAWRNRLAAGGDPDAVRREARDAGLRPMPIPDQMALQWELILAGLAQVAAAASA